MGRLDQKVAFITGAGAGIARAAALVFAREGAKTAIIDVNEDAGENTVRLIRERGSEAIFVHTDITQEHSVKNAVTDTTRHFGRIDILFNCAGGSVAEDNLLADVTELKSVFERTMSVDLFGTMLCCKHVIPEIVKAGGGAVVNMSSGAALRGASPLQVYTSAKGAIVSLTRTLAWAHAAQNVRVNAIAAGRVPTERTEGRHRAQRGAESPLGRFFAQDAGNNYPFWTGEPEDLANVALFLASNESRMITGATIPADGGRSAY